MTDFQILRPFMRHMSAMMATFRPVLKRCLPTVLHGPAGRLGRRLIQSTDQAISLGAQPQWPNWSTAETPGSVDGPIVMVGASLQAGGAEYQLSLLAGGLQKGDHGPVHVLCFHLAEGSKHRFFEPALQNDGVCVHDAIPVAEALATLQGSRRAEDISTLQQHLRWAPADFANDIIRLVAEFERLRPRAVLGWQDSTGLAAAIAASIVGVSRIVVTTRNVNPTGFGYYRPFMHDVYRRLCADGSVLFTSNSRAGASDYEDWLELPAGTFRVIRNGQPDLSTSLPPVRSDKDKPLIGGVFRLDDEKRPLLWLDCAALVHAARPDARFVLVGDGPLRADVERRARRLGLTDVLDLAGRRSDVADMLPTFDLLLLVSQSEGTPNVVLEAARAGVPVVATNAGGTGETVLPGKTGHIVSNDPNIPIDQLADRIARTVVESLDDDALAASTRREGPSFVSEHFGLQRMIDEWRLVLDS